MEKNSNGQLVVIARPITKQADPYLFIDDAGTLDKLVLENGKTITISVDKSTKYCVGWYDIESHTNHLCESRVVVDAKYESCFACRKKTDFNPAFYNTSDISTKQAQYNDAPHSVYVAYFGNGLAKAGIMSDSRGLERLYEQGALLYSIVASCPNATTAHNLENGLIQKGLRNSITKKQKGDALSKVVDIDFESRAFNKILGSIGYANNTIVSNLDMFFFGKYPRSPIREFDDNNPVSGQVRGVVGRYLILENNERLYGYWLTNICGYKVTFSSKIDLIEREPQQISFL